MNNICPWGFRWIVQKAEKLLVLNSQLVAILLLKYSAMGKSRRSMTARGTQVKWYVISNVTHKFLFPGCKKWSVLDGLQCMMTDIIHKAETWFILNNLYVNNGKTHSVIFSLKRLLTLVEGLCFQVWWLIKTPLELPCRPTCYKIVSFSF